MGFFFQCKYTKVISTLKKFGLSVCEGAKHSCAKCIKNGKKTTIPRHNKVKSEVVDKICKLLVEKNCQEKEIKRLMR